MPTEARTNEAVQALYKAIEAGKYSRPVDVVAQNAPPPRTVVERGRRRLEAIGEQNKLDALFEADLCALSKLPAPVNARLYKLVEAQSHADGRRQVAEDFIELTGEVADGFFDAGYPLHPGPLGPLSITEEQRANAPRPKPTDRRWGDSKAKVIVEHGPADSNRFEMIASVALESGAWRVARIDLREIAARLWTHLGA